MQTEIRRKRGRPPRLSHAEILEAAAEISIENLSMMALARRLRTTDAALYYYFPSREALLRALADKLTEEIEMPPLSPDWRHWMRDYAWRIKTALERHPGAAAFLNTGGPTGRKQLHMVETALGVMMRNGLSLHAARLVDSVVVNHVLAFVQRTDREAREKRLGKPDSAMRIMEEVREAGETALPLLQAGLTYDKPIDPDELFEFGLTALISGVAAAPPTLSRAPGI